MSISDHYPAIVRKAASGVSVHTPPIMHITFNGPNARISYGSTELSANIAAQGVSGHIFADVVGAIPSGVVVIVASKEVVASVVQLQKPARTAGYKRAYGDFIQCGANLEDDPCSVCTANYQAARFAPRLSTQATADKLDELA